MKFIPLLIRVSFSITDHLKSMVKEWNTVNPVIEVVPDPEVEDEENKETEYYSYIIDQDKLI